jgi:hypothetical protein
MTSTLLDDLEAWANENYRLSTMTTKGEREYPCKMTIMYLHWDIAKSSIFPIHTQMHVFDGNDCTIKKEQIVSYMKTIDGNTKYKVHEVLFYCMDVEPDNIPAFIGNTLGHSDYLKIYKNIQDITVPSSMFMFHEINCVYVILVDTPKPGLSILKTRKAGLPKNSKTKRVSFHVSSNEDNIQ